MSNKSLYYRVTYNEEGIYIALKKKITNDAWKQMLASNQINWLPKPPTYTTNNKSYFTQKGYKKFNKNVLPLICNYLDKDKITIEVFYELKNIIYSDAYQVVVKE